MTATPETLENASARHAVAYILSSERSFLPVRRVEDLMNSIRRRSGSAENGQQDIRVIKNNFQESPLPAAAEAIQFHIVAAD